MKERKISFCKEDQHFRCFSHIMNLAVQDTLKLINVEIPSMLLLSKDDEFDNSENGSNIFTRDSFSDDKIDDKIDDNSDDETNDEIDKDNEKNIQFSKVISKVRNFCKKIRKSETSTNKLKLMCEATSSNFTKLTLDVRTRWDSTYDMINNFFKLKIALKSFWNTCKEVEKYKISDSEYRIMVILEQIMNFLKYFKQVTKILSGVHILVYLA